MPAPNTSKAKLTYGDFALKPRNSTSVETAVTARRTCHTNRGIDNDTSMTIDDCERDEPDARPLTALGGRRGGAVVTPLPQWLDRTVRSRSVY